MPLIDRRVKLERSQAESKNSTGLSHSFGVEDTGSAQTPRGIVDLTADDDAKPYLGGLPYPAQAVRAQGEAFRREQELKLRLRRLRLERDEVDIEMELLGLQN